MFSKASSSQSTWVSSKKRSTFTKSIFPTKVSWKMQVPEARQQWLPKI